MSRQQVASRLALLLCAAGFALRILRLAAQPYWFDEGLTVDLALAPPAYVLETIDRPPLYYALMHVWIGAAGADAVTFRFFSACWGTVAVALMYRLGRQVLGRRAGLVAMALACFSPFYVYYSQEARTYTLTLALALSSTCALLAWLADGRRRWLALHALATLACLYTHFTALLLPLVQVGFILAKPGPRMRRLAQWGSAQTAAGILFLPWPLGVSGAMPDLVLPGGVLPPLDPWQHAAHLLWTSMVEWSAGRTLAGWLAPAAAVFLLFLVILGAGSPVVAGRARRSLWPALALPLLALLVLPRTATYFSPKYLMLATPAFYLLAASGLETLRRLAPRLWLGCLLLLVLCWSVALGDWFLVEHLKFALQDGAAVAQALRASLQAARGGLG